MEHGPPLVISCDKASSLTHLTFSLAFLPGPWNHVGGFIFGAWVGSKYHSVEKSLVEDINQIRADKGMPPIVGSNAWIRYSAEE